MIWRMVALLEAQDLVDEDRPVDVLRAEAVGGRIELGMALRILEAQRVEIGGEMAAHAIGADHHQGADRIHRRLAHLGGRRLGDRAGAVLRLAGGAALAVSRQRRPVAVEGGDDLAIGGLGPAGPLPGGPLDLLQGAGAVVRQAREELPPIRIDRGGIVEKSGIELLDEMGVGAIEERGVFERLVEICLLHRPRTGGGPPAFLLSGCPKAPP